MTSAGGDGEVGKAASYLAERHTLALAATSGPGRLTPETRRAILDRARGKPGEHPIPPSLTRLVDLVATDAPAITDADIEQLGAEGFDDETIFEAIVASALGASLVRLERVDALLGEGA